MHIELTDQIDCDQYGAYVQIITTKENNALREWRAIYKPSKSSEAILICIDQLPAE